MNVRDPQVQLALDNLGIIQLNPMQTDAMAAIASGDDVILRSPTGSGKTLAFLLPLLSRLRRDLPQVQALVLAPSRELALQIEDVFRRMQPGLKVSTCYGGHNIRIELNNLLEPPALLIGTPGRIIDHLDRGSLDLSTVETIVLDEFDKSLEMGFQPQMAYILERLTALRQRILTSATDLSELPAFVGLQQPRKLDHVGGSDVVPTLATYTVFSPSADKLETLLHLLCTLGDQATLVFLNHREAVERVSAFLAASGVRHEYFHGGLDQDQRERTLVKFRNGSMRVLVATDLAARGLDIPEIAAVVHYHLPMTADAYIHRNGRTARMHADGAAYIILGPEERIPPFIPEEARTFSLPNDAEMPPQPEWETIYVSKGRKSKVNKVDIVGFLCQKGGLTQTDLGLIVVKDDCAYVAVRMAAVRSLLQRVRNEKLKGQSVVVKVAK